MRRHMTLIGIYISIFPVMLGNGMIMTLLPGRVMETTGSMSAVGGIASAFALTYLMLQLPLGRLGDRYGFKRILAAGYALCGLSGLIYLQADSAWGIYLGRALQGAGEVPLWALAAAVLSIAYPDKKGRVMGGYNALFHLGLFAGPLAGLGSALWRGSKSPAFIYYTAACFSGALLIYVLVAEPRRENAISQPGPSGPILSLFNSWGPLQRLFVGISLYGMAYGIMLTVVPAYLATAKRLEPFYISLFFAIFFLGVSFAQVVAGWLSDKGMGRRCMVAGLFLAAGGLAAATGVDGPVVLTALAAASFGLGGYHAASLAELNAQVPAAMKGAISGAYYLFWGIGYFAGPLAAGLCCDRMGSAAGLCLPAALLAAGGLLPVLGKEGAAVESI